MGIFTTTLRNKKIRQILDKNRLELGPSNRSTLKGQNSLLKYNLAKFTFPSEKESRPDVRRTF